jgi:hypothetical protein
VPAYNRGEEKVEGYLVRVLTAIVRAAGGELRVKGELIDEVNEATVLTKGWDKTKQELVLRAGMESFVEVYRVSPVRVDLTQAVKPVDPLEKLLRDGPLTEESFTRKSSTVDNPNLFDLERKATIRRAAANLKQDLARLHREAAERPKT